MTLKNTILLYLATLAVFFLIDMVWLGLVAKNFYRQQLGELLSPKVTWWAAILFYLLFIAGLQIFVVAPALGAGRGAAGALARGAVRPGRLCHLRPDQPGHAEKLAADGDRRRPRLGSGAGRNGLLLRGADRPLAAQELIRPASLRFSVLTGRGNYFMIRHENMQGELPCAGKEEERAITLRTAAA
jgi:Predicted membrane protein